MTNEEKLRAVEQLLVSMRWARQYPTHPEHAQWLALKEIAADLLAKQPAQHGTARHAIGARIAAAVRDTRPDGRYRDGHLITIGQSVIGQWRVIEHALERCEKEPVV